MEINLFFHPAKGKTFNVNKNKSVKTESLTFGHCKNKKSAQ